MNMGAIIGGFSGQLLTSYINALEYHIYIESHYYYSLYFYFLR